MKQHIKAVQAKQGAIFQGGEFERTLSLLAAQEAPQENGFYQLPVDQVLNLLKSSGQRLLKILKLLRELQVQVLTLLVAAGEKLRVKLDDQALSPQDSDQAREE